MWGREGKDTRFLLDLGFKVTAIDKDPFAEEIINELSNENLKFEQTTFQDFKPDKYDLVNAQWSIPFTNPEKFDDVLEKIKKSINPGGIFTGQLFGVNDEWNNGDGKMTFNTKEEVLELFAGWKIIKCVEKDEDSQLANGTPKHWHVFHIIAQKLPVD